GFSPGPRPLSIQGRGPNLEAASPQAKCQREPEAIHAGYYVHNPLRLTVPLPGYPGSHSSPLLADGGCAGIPSKRHPRHTDLHWLRFGFHPGPRIRPWADGQAFSRFAVDRTLRTGRTVLLPGRTNPRPAPGGALRG